MVVAFVATGAIAQEQGKIRGGANIGWCIPKGGGGVCFDLQAGYNLSDDMTVGIKWGYALMGKVDPKGEVGSIVGNSNLLGTFTYFLNMGSFAPFVGAGAGLYTVAGGGTGLTGFVIEPGNKFGGMLTAGFEFKRFRLGLEYNLIPSSDAHLVSVVGPQYGSVKNSYMALTFGFYLGGGKRAQ